MTNLPKMTNLRRAIQSIKKEHVLLVYPVQNRPLPRSLWSALHPRTPMRWEWDQGGDDRVARLWQLRAELSASGKVVYAKWYQGRATFFSLEVFPLVLAALGTPGSRPVASDSRELLGLLEEDSPLSPRQIKKLLGWEGKAGSVRLDRCLRELWMRLFIVGFGEVEDGAFPSLAIGATQVLFDPLWAEASLRPRSDPLVELEKVLGKDNPFFTFLSKVRTKGLSNATGVKGKKLGGTVRYKDLVGD